MPTTPETSATSPLVRKALGAARLAVSAEKISSEEEALSTGRLAGELAFRAGLTMSDLFDVWEGTNCCASWGAAVDGYHDLRDASLASSTSSQKEKL